MNGIDMQGGFVTTQPQYNTDLSFVPRGSQVEPVAPPQYTPYSRAQYSPYGSNYQQPSPYGQQITSPYGQQIVSPYGQPSPYGGFGVQQPPQPQPIQYSQAVYQQHQFQQQQQMHTPSNYELYGGQQTYGGYGGYQPNSAVGMMNQSRGYVPRDQFGRVIPQAPGMGGLYGNEQARQNAMGIAKIKLKMAGRAMGKVYTEEELDEMLRPKPITPVDEEKRMVDNEFRAMQYLGQVFKQPPLPTRASITAQVLYETSNNFHQAFDNASMAEFFEEIMWQMNRDNFYRTYVKRDGNKDLSRTYAGTAYNELVKMHTTESSYINSIMDTSRFDNNVDDMEIGVDVAFDLERRKRKILEGQVPEYAPPEVAQERREKWLALVAEQMFKKTEKRLNTNV